MTGAKASPGVEPGSLQNVPCAASCPQEPRQTTKQAGDDCPCMSGHEATALRPGHRDDIPGIGFGEPVGRLVLCHLATLRAICGRHGQQLQQALHRRRDLGCEMDHSRAETWKRHRSPAGHRGRSTVRRGALVAFSRFGVRSGGPAPATSWQRPRRSSGRSRGWRRPAGSRRRTGRAMPPPCDPCRSPRPPANPGLRRR